MDQVAVEPKRVFTAEAPHHRDLGRTGMYIRQYKFPDTYTEQDVLTSVDHDRIAQQKRDHFGECVKKHKISGGPMGDWIKRSTTTNEQVMNFIKDLLEADPDQNWTGYRVTESTNRSNGYPVYHLELFARHPKSQIQVYTGVRAPNVDGEYQGRFTGIY